jgi:AraC-like DNA-binding protein
MLPAPIMPYIRMADYAVRSPWRTDIRRLLDYLLVYVQEGRFVVSVSGVDYDVPPGSFCLIQPNELHTLHGHSKTITPFAHMDFFYNPRREESFATHSFQTDLRDLQDLLQPRLNDLPGIAIPVVFQPTDAHSFRETMIKMIGTWQQRDLLSQMQSQHAALGLILALLQQFSTLANPAINQPQSLNWVTAYCSFHLAEPLSVADMAARAHLSPSHFSAIFRQRFGVSPHQYLLHLRVQRAQELLLTSHYSLAQISEQCGFADVHHFSKVFKRVFGLPPGAYRDRQQRR